jgi:N4-gp56 family major capsid protein
LEDIILRDFLLSAAGVYNCKGGVDGDNPTEITTRDLSNVASFLDSNNAFKFVTGKIGEDRFGSSPIRSGYILLCSTELQPAFDGIDKFTSSWNYPNNNDAVYCEYGSILNMRIYTSSESAVQRGASMNGNDVYNNMAVARESYAHIDQDGYSSQLIYRPPIFSGPLALNGTLGVKFAQTQALLQETWIRNVRCTLVS